MRRPKAETIDDFLDAFFYRTKGLLEAESAGTICREAVAFETLLSAYSALAEGCSHNDIESAYPLTAWRERTVTIPKALLETLLNGWVKYRDAPSGSTFGEAFNLEGGGQGKHPVRHALKAYNEEIRLSQEVLVEYLAHSATEQRISYEQAIFRVAEKNGVSESKVKKASERFRQRMLERIGKQGWLSEPE